MKIDSLKDLEKLVKLMKKQGIKAIKVDNLEFAINADKPIDQDIFPEALVKVPKFNGAFNDEPDKIETDGLTDEQRLFYSAKEEPGTDSQEQ